MMQMKANQLNRHTQSVITLVVLVAGLFVIISGNYDESTQKWAFSIVGMILGASLRRRSD
jgi:hypothetical protein